MITPTKLLEQLCELKSVVYNLKRNSKTVENPNVKVIQQIDGDEVKVPRKETLYTLEIYKKEFEGTDHPPELVVKIQDPDDTRARRLASIEVL